MEIEDAFDGKCDSPVKSGVEAWSETSPEYEQLVLKEGDVLRIEETVGANWSGVSSCCDQSRVNSEAKSAFDAWVQKKLFEYRHLRYIRYGQTADATGRCSRSDGGIGGPRRCRAYINIPAFIEFRKL